MLIKITSRGYSTIWMDLLILYVTTQYVPAWWVMPPPCLGQMEKSRLFPIWIVGMWWVIFWLIQMLIALANCWLPTFTPSGNPLGCSVINIEYVSYFTAEIYPFIDVTFMITRNLNYSSSVWFYRNLFPVFLPTFGIYLRNFYFSIQLPPTWCFKIRMFLFCLSFPDMSSPSSHVPLLL